MIKKVQRTQTQKCWLNWSASTDWSIQNLHKNHDSTRQGKFERFFTVQRKASTFKGRNDKGKDGKGAKQGWRSLTIWWICILQIENHLSINFPEIDCQTRHSWRIPHTCRTKSAWPDEPKGLSNMPRLADRYVNCLFKRILKLENAYIDMPAFQSLYGMRTQLCSWKSQHPGKGGDEILTVIVMAIFAAFFMLAVSLILGLCFIVLVISINMMHCSQVGSLSRSLWVFRLPYWRHMWQVSLCSYRWRYKAVFEEET